MAGPSVNTQFVTVPSWFFTETVNAPQDLQIQSAFELHVALRDWGLIRGWEVEIPGEDSQQMRQRFGTRIRWRKTKAFTDPKQRPEIETSIENTRRFRHRVALHQDFPQLGKIDGFA